MTQQDSNPQEKTFDPEMTEGDEANVPEGTRDQAAEEEEVNVSKEIPTDPERPT
jgi:hypothetical protein